MGELYLIGGLHSVRTALRHGGDAVIEVWVDKRRKGARIHEILDLARQAAVKLNRVEREELDRISAVANHQGVVARTRVPAAADDGALRRWLDALQEPPFLLVLDSIQDPHNLGACLRSADAVGVHAVIAPKDRSVGLTPTACKVASGAAQSVRFAQVTNLAHTLRWMRDELGIWAIGAAGDAQQSLFDCDLTGPIALALGSEHKGLRRLTRDCCDQLVRIPMRGKVESLNVSVAAGVCLFEALRQRQGSR